MATKVDRRTLLREAARRIDPHKPDGYPRPFTDLHDLEDRQVAALLRTLAGREPTDREGEDEDE